MEALECCSPQLPSAPQNTPVTAAKKVHWDPQGGPKLIDAASRAQQAKAAAASAAASQSAPLLVTNQLFSPAQGGGPGRKDSNEWVIQAQRSGSLMEPLEQQQPQPGSVLSGATTAISDTSPMGAYTPASSSWLESARKVDDLRGRLESLEASLREMESKAVAHLDKSLQDKVLATAAKIVQKRFMADKQLDKKLEEHILRTAIKLVKRQGATQGDAAATAAPAAVEEDANPQRRLEFEQQQGEAGAAATASATAVEQYVAHVEQGLGEVLRRLEKKVDGVASLVDRGALELLEARLAGGVAALEARLGALEAGAEAQRQPPAAADSSRQLLERVAAMESAMAEQSRAVTDLLRALGTAGASQQAGAAVAAVQAAVAAEPEAAAREERREEKRPATAAAQAQPAAQERGREREREQQREQAPAAAAPAQRPQPQAELHQRRSAAAKRSVLGDPARAAAAGAAAGPSCTRPSQRDGLPRLKPSHTAGTAQQIAIATARQQLALQAQRAKEEAEVETPVWVTMFYVFGWGALGLLGLAAVLVGMAASLVKAGRLSQDDLSFLFK